MPIATTQCCWCLEVARSLSDADIACYMRKSKGRVLPHEAHSWGVSAFEVSFEPLGVAPIQLVTLLFKVGVQIIRTTRLLVCDKLQRPGSTFVTSKHYARSMRGGIIPQSADVAKVIPTLYETVLQTVNPLQRNSSAGYAFACRRFFTRSCNISRGKAEAGAVVNTDLRSETGALSHRES